MTVKAFLMGHALQHMGNISAWPRFYVADTWAEMGSTGLIPGSLCFSVDDAKLRRATTSTNWAEVGGEAGGAAWGSITGTLSDQSDLNTALAGKAASSHTHTAANISDSTATGRAVLTAVDAPAARTAIGAGTSSFNGAYGSLSGVPSTFAPSAHKTSHENGGADELALDASQVTTGQFVMARIASGTPDGTKFVRDDGTLASPGASSTNIKQTEIDFGATPVSEASFVVTDADVSAGSQILGFVAYEAPTGKDLDELEMDGLDLKFAPGSGSLTIYARGLDGYVADKFKVNYLIG